MREFKDTLTFPDKPMTNTEAYQVRGECGVHEIKLKPEAKPLYHPPCRSSGLRDAAFTELLQKFIERGFIYPSETPTGCASRAFIVPKPNGKWRMVIDYRYLNSMIEDDSGPLPVIEDLIATQGKNCLWSIFDLEDGFHQLNLAEQS